MGAVDPTWELMTEGRMTEGGKSGQEEQKPREDVLRVKASH